jgi:hypothetical protein
MTKKIKADIPIEVKEEVFEIRFKPNPKILDFRGMWTELFSQSLDYEHWKIEENKLDIFNKDQTERAFLSYKNCGFTCLESPTENYFLDKGFKFFKLLYEIKEFESPLTVERIGIRHKYIVEDTQGFEHAQKGVVNNFISPSTQAKNIFGENIQDLAFMGEFSNPLYNLTLRLSPVRKEEIEGNIRKAIIPEAGIMVDMDFFSKPAKQLTFGEIQNFIKLTSLEGRKKYQETLALIFKD